MYPVLPVRRRLSFTPYRTNYKRARFSTPNKQTNAVQSLNKRTITRPFRRTGTLRQQLKSLQSAVKKLEPEIKYLDVEVDATNVTAAGSVVHVSAIAQSDTDSGRTGNAVNVKTVHFSGAFVRTASTYGTNGMYRLCIFIDKQQVADTSPTLADVFENAAQTAQLLPKLSNLERFKVVWISPIKDAHRMALQQIVLPAIQGLDVQYTWKGNLKVEFNGTAGTDIQKNGIYVGILSNDTANVVDFDGICRIGYTDV